MNVENLAVCSFIYDKGNICAEARQKPSVREGKGFFSLCLLCYLLCSKASSNEPTHM
jgi:hypothetical protein